MQHSALVHFIPNIGGWITLRHLIVVLSILAYVVNISGIVPQLRAMLRARSSRGQSPVGWLLAGSCSASLMFVNVVGYHALLLAAGNLLSLSGCLAAAMLARHFRDPASVAPEALEALQQAPAEVVSELPAPELHALTETVLEEHHRRTGEPIPEETVAEMATGEFQALAELVLEEHHRRTGSAELSLVSA
jgi:hypothetical protein